MAQRALRRGDTVRIRGERWRIAAAAKYARVAILDVDGCDSTNANTRTRFILPFDTPQLAGPTTRAPRVVSLERWRRSARAVLARALPRWSALRTAAGARLTILPFQLEPSLAMTRGDACRFLIADAVGLGKTIQAGLMIAETAARIADARALVVTPAGLREQWRDELAARFDIAAAIVDAGTIARESAQHAADVNPWTVHSTAITSIDFVKRPDVVRALEALTWDIVVFDEAHALAGRSDRAAAATAIAERARVLVLLSATPHSGDDEAFARVCGLGRLGDGFPLRIFHRTRAEAGLIQSRRSSRIAVRPTAAERTLHRALEGYTRRLTAGGTRDGAGALVASILHRRACSSAFSLARSLERRLALMTAAPADMREQPALPFMEADSDDEPGSELGGAWLPSSNEERTWIARLIALARLAEDDESKLSLLRRLLRRIDEPVIVFTEYRDTLQRLRAALLEPLDPIELHGGLTATERRHVLRRFTEGAARVLIATDAASEGLNLHHRCRLVINLEIPWTPSRLEQRVGRVDRLGQARRVHAICLVADGTREASMTMRLDARSERIAAAFEHPAATHRSLAADAIAEAARLATVRRLDATAARTIIEGQPPLAVVDRRVAGRRSDRAAVWAFHLPYVTDDGEPVLDTLAGVLDSNGRVVVAADVADAAVMHHAAELRAVANSIEPWIMLARQREHAMASALRRRQARLSAGLLQPGLFDRRAERATAAQTTLVQSALERSSTRLAWLDRLGRLRADTPSLAFGIAYR